MFLFVARIASAGLSLVQISSVARLLVPSEYAIVATASALSGYFMLLAEPPILGYERRGHHDRAVDLQDTPEAARPAALSQLAAIGFVLVAGLVVWAVVAGDPGLAVAAGVWAVSLVQLRWVSVQYLMWNEQQSYGLVLMVNSFSRVVAMVGAAAVTRDGAWTLIVGAVGSIIATALVSPRWRPVHWNTSGWGPLARVGLPLTVASAAWVSLTNWPTLLGSWSLPTDEFAAYAAQTALATAITGVTIGFITVFGFPQAKRAWDSGDPSGAGRVERRYFGYIAALTPVMALVAWFAGDTLTRLVLGPQYVGHVVLTVGILYLAVRSMTNVAGWILRLDYKQTLVATISVVSALAQAALTWLMIDRFGLPGLLIAVTVVFALQALAVVAFARLAHRWQEIIFVILAAGAAVGLAGAA